MVQRRFKDIRVKKVADKKKLNPKWKHRKKPIENMYKTAEILEKSSRPKDIKMSIQIRKKARSLTR